jgi:hypothetical protein
MPTVFINGLAVPLPYQDKEGDPINEMHAHILGKVLHRRVKARLRWLLQRGEIAPEELPAKAEELCQMELVPHLTFDDGDDEDPILVEALGIARELIMTKMAEEGIPLPPPKNLDLHAKALVNGKPAIQEEARRRLEARYKAAVASVTLAEGASVE